MVGEWEPQFSITKAIRVFYSRHGQPLSVPICASQTVSIWTVSVTYSARRMRSHVIVNNAAIVIQWHAPVHSQLFIPTFTTKFTKLKATQFRLYATVLSCMWQTSQFIKALCYTMFEKKQHPAQFVFLLHTMCDMVSRKAVQRCLQACSGHFSCHNHINGATMCLEFGKAVV